MLVRHLAEGSVNAYMSEWKNWTKWCKANYTNPFKPCETELAAYICDEGTQEKADGGFAYPTLKNYLYGIGHFLAGGGKLSTYWTSTPCWTT